MRAQFDDSVIGSGRTNEHCGSFKGVKPRIPKCDLGESDALDVHTIHLMNLGHQQVDERLVITGEFNHELIDDPPRTSFENVDTGNIAADCADPTRQRTECSGSIRHPDPKDVRGLHGRNDTKRW